MPKECSTVLFEFAPVAGRQVVAGFRWRGDQHGRQALLLGSTDRAIELTERFAACFANFRLAEQVEHQVVTLVAQRVFGIALG